MNHVLTLLLLASLLLLSCSEKEKVKGQTSKHKQDTLVVVTYLASINSDKIRIAQSIVVADSMTNLTFIVNKEKRVVVKTSQLTNYRYTINDIYNAKIDTAEISDNILIITPLDTVFGFKMNRNFDKQPAILSWTDYDKQSDSVQTKFMKLKNTQVVGKLTLHAKR